MTNDVTILHLRNTYDHLIDCKCVRIVVGIAVVVVVLVVVDGVQLDESCSRWIDRQTIERKKKREEGSRRKIRDGVGWAWTKGRIKRAS